ncbi:diaminopimelate epimerase [Halocatena pleomorpha]|uniref:Diaminopimelate epimerase n=1 Tax=Halocatena pleomorpha TaxID=1785090 RepID=A0A3P3RHW7_9EURY|nr:diaminopimelate epimerase [Halocatena pleomorpha]RRJ32955.1 diaminopimelate epimerase [Halocatena pleomorpha]
MIHVEKYHGTGNDFIVVDAALTVPDRRAFATKYCDRETGISQPDAEAIGADGVLFLALEEQYSPPRVVMTLVQPDGSVAAMCGNGVRCAAAWAAEKTGSDELMIDTLAGTRRATVGDDTVRVEMGQPSFDPDTVPITEESPLVEASVDELTVTAVNTGVPHAVAFVEDVAAVDLQRVGPSVRNAPVFPEGANVTIASRDTERTDTVFEQRTFERGVEDETASCGTGAVAVAAAARRLGRIDGNESVTVRPDGGTLEVTVSADETTLSGPVTRSFATELPVTEPRRIS